MSSDTLTSATIYLQCARKLLAIQTSARHRGLELYDYPFDLQLLTLSRLYRESRRRYIEIGGHFSPRISSTMRSLSAQDLFSDHIEYSPAATEIKWLTENVDDVHDLPAEVTALERFSTISVFHEQNHRVLWRLLPPPGKSQDDLRRYLNFAEALVVMLDIALADELDPHLSETFEHMKVVYRTGRTSQANRRTKEIYRTYLVSACLATYLLLELVNPEDILNAVNYILPGQTKLNREAVSRASDISELFTRITNPEWHERNWRSAGQSLRKFHRASVATPLHIAADPLEIEHELFVVNNVFAAFKI